MKIICNVIYQHGLVYAFPEAMSLRSCCGNQLPTVFETQIINLLPVYIGSQNTKQLKYVNLEAAKLSPHSFQLWRSQHKIHKLPMPWRFSLFSEEFCLNAVLQIVLHFKNVTDTFTVRKMYIELNIRNKEYRIFVDRSIHKISLFN